MIERRKKSRTQSRSENKEFSAESLKKEILKETRLLKISDTVAETIAERVTAQVEKWISRRTAVTVDDLNQQIAKELEKYDADLSYVYRNRGKII